ncbi:MAG TPA: hypothetical protein VLA77_01585 [Candidatus Saccharimonadales bacterium]|nr:hypothetical protein [Candidatus Saccharimonadales bacterium]
MAKNKVKKSSPASNTSPNGSQKKDNNGLIYAIFLILLALLLAWAGWMLWRSQRSATPLDTAALQTGLTDTAGELGTIGTTGSGGGSTTTIVAVPGATGATGAAGKPGANGSNGGDGSNGGVVVPEVDLGTLSLGLNAGDSRATVESKLGVSPTSCAVVSDLPVVGTTELCTFRNSAGGEVQVLYLNNSVIDIVRIGL